MNLNDRKKLEEASEWMRLAMSKSFTAEARRQYITSAHKLVQQVLDDSSTGLEAK